MEALTERQRFILSLIIHEYVRTATPVASQQLVQQFKLDMSSATVRNELAELTEMGMLRQPHSPPAPMRLSVKVRRLSVWPNACVPSPRAFL
jgi:predicted transcriptional regulator